MKIVVSIAAVLIVTGFVFWKDINNMVVPGKDDVKKEKKKDKQEIEGNNSDNESSEGIVIRQQWDLPEILKEVSGIAWLDKDRFACVQDELGTIFIYNTGADKIEKQIQFAGPGDYEGVTVNGDMAYVVRADGRLYEVNMDEGKKSLKEYPTHLTVEQNVEGLCYEKKNNRLLVAIKGDEPGNKNYKGIYSFDLVKKELARDPVYKIDLGNSIFATTKSKKSKSIMPSAIAVHPTTGDLYISDGPAARLLIMDQSGRMKALYNLGKKFAQPEGVTFGPDGQLFISNEGSKQSGNILQVEIQP
jgi:uncharacterized protein YjiK